MNTEPTLSTDPALAGVLAQLVAREPIFHRPQFGTSRADFEAMTAVDFWEVGASGQRYSREYVLGTLEKRHSGGVTRDPDGPNDLQASGFHCRHLAGPVYLLTYTLLQPGERWTRRSTLWEQTHEGWKIVYHQGTLVERPGPDPPAAASRGTATR